ncbi:MAG: hypothetical protein B6U85_05085 [Desulfurococcales archaeon ex4484_42]|nr:MAG: hypothetical protein B6U85_05085 [Desulfurococcales archaeon ex4484_42]
MLYVSLQIAFIILTTLIVPILDGIERKIKAKLHSRIGPPILQTWYDIRKLFAKELVLTRTAFPILLVSLVMVGLCILTLLVIPAGSSWTFFSSMSLPLLIVLIASIHSLIIVTSIVSDNLYAIIGGFRELTIGIINEIALIIALVLTLINVGLGYSGSQITTGIKVSYISAVILLAISSYVASGRIPFDLGEAEPELASGVLIELSGPVLGTVLYSIILKRFIFASITALALFLPFMRLLNPLLAFILFILLIIAVWIVHAVTAVLLGRSRVDIATKTLICVYIALIFLSTIFTGVGL